MIPLRSSERIYSQPMVTIWLIAINLVVFIYELSLQSRTAVDVGYGQYSQLDLFIQHYGLVPYLFGNRPFTVLTSMFLHGGWMHVLGNMWFLWIFGRAVEDSLGPWLFLMFYLTCGVAAGLMQDLMAVRFGDAATPTIGASGAIAGVMGGYLIRFPRSRIATLIFFFFITVIDIPAAFLLLYWFGIQFFQGVVSVGELGVRHSDVAWFAHVGGFIAGMGLIMALPARQRSRRWW